MRKIPSLFRREDAPRGKGSLVVPVVTPGCEWVLLGEGTPTRKRDGTAVMLRRDEAPFIWKRYDAKRGKKPPVDFLPAQDPDPVTGHWPGWLPVSENNPADAWILLAVANSVHDGPSVLFSAEPTSTWEACGPQINGNPEGLSRHVIFRHGIETINADGCTYVDPVTGARGSWRRPHSGPSSRARTASDATWAESATSAVSRGRGEHEDDCPLVKAPCGCTPRYICEQHRCDGRAMDGSRCVYKAGHSWNCES